MDERRLLVAEKLYFYDNYLSSPATRLTAHAMKIVKRNLISSESNTSKWTSV